MKNLRKKCTAAALAAALASTFMLGGCGARQGATTGGGNESLTEVELPEGISWEDTKAQLAWQEENQTPESFEEAVKQFSWKTASALLAETEGNRNYSPLSLYYALALTAQGASGSTETELLQLLGVDKKEELADACGKLFRLLYRENETGRLMLADSLWMQEESQFKKNFIRTAQEDFYADLFRVDFTDGSTGQAMGEWVSEHTGGTLAPEWEDVEEVVLAVLNTVWLQDEWSVKFSEDWNTEGSFAALAGGETDAVYMNQEYDFLPWLVGEGYTGTRLGLKNTGGMVLILPEEGTDIRDLLTEEKLEEIFAGPEADSGKVELKLPKFTFGDRMELVPLLKELGVTSAFGLEADFSAMTDGQVFISQIRQETHVGVNEDGVEASAFTEVMLAGGSAPAAPADVLRLELDRPFLYGIVDDSGLPLFLGICGNPRGDAGEASSTAPPAGDGDSEMAPPVGNGDSETVSPAGGKGTEAALPARAGGTGAVRFDCEGTADPAGGVFRLSMEDGFGEEAWYYDEFFLVERYEDGEWLPLPIIGGFCGNTSYWRIGEDLEQDELQITWEYIYEKLTAGTYCLVKEVFPEQARGGPDLERGRNVYAVFEVEDPLGLSLEVRDVSPEGLTMQFLRNGGNPTGELQYGEEYWVERLEDRRWVRLEGDMDWGAVAIMMDEDGSAAQIVDWQNYYGTLPEGRYRFCKEVMDYRAPGDYDTYEYQAEFEIP